MTVVRSGKDRASPVRSRFVEVLEAVDPDLIGAGEAPDLGPEPGERTPLPELEVPAGEGLQLAGVELVTQLTTEAVQDIAAEGRSPCVHGASDVRDAEVEGGRRESVEGLDEEPERDAVQIPRLDQSGLRGGRVRHTRRSEDGGPI